MLYELAVLQPVKMLDNLSAILAKAEHFAQGKKVEMTVLLQSRLAPDQFPLIRQIQIACDTAKLGIARLTGNTETAPRHDDDETTLAELQQRIHEVQSYMLDFKSVDLVGALEQPITQARWEGKHLTGQDYIIQYLLPNLYFHITTAYGILRHNGVELGKKDYLGPMPLK